MKAISIRQPWAGWIVQGRKTLELRTWMVSHRGPLAIHASQTINRDACYAHGINPQSLTTGAVIGTVELLEIVRLDESSFVNQQEKHLAAGFFKLPKPEETLFAWKLTNPRPLAKPIPYRGRMGLFSIPDSDIQTESQTETDLLPDQKIQDWDPRQAFELQVIPDTKKPDRKNSYRLAIFQRYLDSPLSQSQMNPPYHVKMRSITELGGDVLKAVADQVLDALRENGYKATDLSVSRHQPFYLTEESGVRLGLLFLAVHPLRRLERVEMISHGLRQMTAEELYYWYSKCTGIPNGDRSLRAMRLLLAEK
jgi:hypothetical protein